jgi:hypothetical protein
MKMKIKGMFLLFVLSLLSFAGIAMANTGLQTTPYSTPTFSATFSGPVTADSAARNKQNTSTDYSYYSGTATGQLVIVRRIDHDIDVNQASADFYADTDTTGGTTTNRSESTWQGHVFTYTRRVYVENGQTLSKRTRYIVVSPREVIFLEQIDVFTKADSTEDLAAQQQWFDFENSLDIK